MLRKSLLLLATLSAPLFMVSCSQSPLVENIITPKPENQFKWVKVDKLESLFKWTVKPSLEVQNAPQEKFIYYYEINYSNGTTDKNNQGGVTWNDLLKKLDNIIGAQDNLYNIKNIRVMKSYSPTPPINYIEVFQTPYFKINEII